ncbi:putative polysaccharide biosynthesis protein [Liquorilactobacillus uvarum]|uniref:PST family polysaccharide transporter n=1 Tax=Liquorilactobacillus uvarum DSM 19971 TaxID=1423812 RepID=A0A0R1Q8Q8_9LACO|nr:oligosaccharide flippase family protein [Liquorilactobacillus uvarum]KRL37747.1 PST family polysaccharide transporter [Liquorilactobacillus uvarum DSM 19971]
MMNKQVNKMMKGTAVLTVASLIAKILSAFYRIPFENLVGNTGFYIYQQIYPIYGIGMTFALTGFPMYISKIIAQEEKKQAKDEIAREVFFFLLLLGVSVFLFLQIGASWIGRAMGDAKLSVLIKSVAWMYLLMPILAVGRGYYQGIFNMVPTALSQLLEQVVRVTVIIAAAAIAVSMNWSLYRMGSWAMLGSTFGAIAATLFFCGFYFRLLSGRKNFSLNMLKKMGKQLFSKGLTICLFTAMMVLLQLVDSFTVKEALQNSGYQSAKAKELKGIYDRAQPLIQMGLVISVSFSTALLPLLTEKFVQNKLHQFKLIARMIIRVCLGISSAASVGLMILMPEINISLFGDDLGSVSLAISMLTIIFATLLTMYNAFLQSLDQYWQTFLTLVVILSVKILCNSFFVQHLGIEGASIATVLSLVVGCFMIKTTLPQMGKHLLGTDRFLLKLITCIFIMTLITLGCTLFLEEHIYSGRLGSILETCIGVVAGCVSFVVSASTLNLFTLQEWSSIPGGRRVFKLFNRK